MKSLINKLLVFLGFTSLSSCILEEMYGVPYADFSVKGSVKNESNEALSEVRVYRPAGIGADTTKVDGKFTVNWTNDATDMFYTIVATDLNGIYENDTVRIPYEDFKFRKSKKNKDSWYYGKGEKEVSFVLKKK